MHQLHHTHTHTHSRNINFSAAKKRTQKYRVRPLICEMLMIPIIYHTAISLLYIRYIWIARRHCVSSTNDWWSAMRTYILFGIICAMLGVCGIARNIPLAGQKKTELASYVGRLCLNMLLVDARKCVWFLVKYVYMNRFDCRDWPPESRNHTASSVEWIIN